VVIASPCACALVIRFAGRAASELRGKGLPVPAGPERNPRSGCPHRKDLTGARLEFRTERFLERGSATYAWIRSAEGFADAWRLVAEFEMRIVLARSFAWELPRRARRPDRIARRNIPFSPRRGRPVIVSRDRQTESGRSQSDDSGLPRRGSDRAATQDQ